VENSENGLDSGLEKDARNCGTFFVGAGKRDVLTDIIMQERSCLCTWQTEAQLVDEEMWGSFLSNWNGIAIGFVISADSARILSSPFQDLKLQLKIWVKQ